MSTVKFTGDLSSQLESRILVCDGKLHDPSRLATLKSSGLMDSPREAAFDRLASLAARILEVPLTIISLVGESKQFFKAGFGLPAPYDTIREIPVDSSICRYTLAGEEIIASNAKLDPLLMYHPTTEPWGIGAFIAIPMVMANGHVLGAFCAVDPQARIWSDKDIEIMRELTASVMTEIEFREKVLALESERLLREKFVMALTHDLRTPLTSARIQAQLIQRKPEDTEQVSQLSANIVTSVDRIDMMARDLLDANRLKSGEALDLVISDCRIDTVVMSTLEDLARVHGPRFEFENSAGEVTGQYNADALRRMIENLCTNAVKYGEPGAKVRVSLDSTTAHTVTLSIHNHGNPIDRADQLNLFDPFHRTAAAKASGQKGWGIGLGLVKGIAEAHNGKVEVISNRETGTTFSVTLPWISKS